MLLSMGGDLIEAVGALLPEAALLGESEEQKRGPFDATARAPARPRIRVTFSGGPGRDRTDDIHGVNVALYQLSYRPPPARRTRQA